MNPCGYLARSTLPATFAGNQKKLADQKQVHHHSDKSTTVMKPFKLTPIGIGLAAVLLFSSAPAVSAQTLTHRYSFNDAPGSTTFADSVGTASGTLNNATAVNANSASLDGAQLQLDGTGGYAVLPSGMISGNTQVTIEFWASFGSNPTWTRVFAFGDQTDTGGENTGLDYCPYAGGNYQNLNIQTAAGSGYANNNMGLNNETNVHVTVVVDPVHANMYYYNGTTLISSLSGTVPPLSGINDVYGLIGRSLDNVDPTLTGSIDEFRIYSGVTPIATVAINDASGPNTILSNPGTIEALHFSSPVNPLVVEGSSQDALTGDFSSVTGLNLILYGGATFTSLNTGVVTINTNGVVKAVAPGSAEVVATYGTVRATNLLTVISIPATLAHRYSFTTDASDSVGGANGTLMGTASVSGGQLVLDGSSGCYLDLPASQINLATNVAVSFDAWVAFGAPTTWAELFAFGNTNNGNGIDNIACVPCAESGGFHNWGLTENLANGQTLSWAHGWNNVTAHITSVLDPQTGTMSTYFNGVLELARYDASAPISGIATNYAFIGHSLFNADPYLPASIDEFRIYSGALTPAQVAMSQQSGPNSTSINPGSLNSIAVVPTNYPAYAALVAPVILANYANLANFNLLPTTSAGGNPTLSGPQGLVVRSSNTNIVSVNAQNMLTTYRPGTVTLTASFGGETNSATIVVKNEAKLTHRYSFAADGSDSIGGANGTLKGTASVSGGQLQLDGGTADYLSLPGGMLSNYTAVTVDAWVNFAAVQNWSRLWEFFDNNSGGTQNELYFAPGWNPNPPTANFYSAGFPWGNSVLTSGALNSGQNYHITCEYGDGQMMVYTNAVLMASLPGGIAPASSAGNLFATIGYSPYGDPGINGSVDEFRIYSGRLAQDEITASDFLGPNQTLSTTASLNATVSSGTVGLSWPLASAGFSVQVSSSLTSPNWATLTNVPALAGNTNWGVSMPASGSQQFFRLWR
jgi:hypothetical protein